MLKSKSHMYVGEMCSTIQNGYETQDDGKVGDTWMKFF